MNKILLVLFISYTAGVSAQTKLSQIDTLLSKSKFFTKKNTDSMLYYADKAYILSLETKDPNVIGKTIIAKSSSLLNLKRYDEAIKLLEINLNNNKELDSSDYVLGATYFNLGAISHQIEQRDKAIFYYLLAIEVFSAQNDLRNIARSYMGVGAAYDSAGQIEYAQYFYGKSSEYISLSKTGDIHSGDMKLVSTSNRVKNCLNLLANIPVIETSRVAAEIYEDLSEAYLEKKDYKNALEAGINCIKIKESQNFLLNISHDYYLIAESLAGLGKISEAITFYKKALKNNEKINLKANCYQKLIQLYKQQGNFKESLLYSEKYNGIKDSIHSFQESVRIADITGKYETKEKEKQIIALQEENERVEVKLNKHQKRWLLWLSLAAFLLISTLWMGRRWKRSQIAIKRVRKEKEVVEKKVEAQHLLLKSKSKIYLDELFFVKSEGNYVEFHSVEKKILERDKLKEILEKLPPNFVKVHRSYIVNKNQIESFNSSTVFLKSGQEIPLSRTYKDNL